jgi:hypothetical protein
VKKSPLLNEAYFNGTVNEGVTGCKVTTYPEIEGSYSPQIKNSGEEKSTSK